MVDVRIVTKTSQEAKWNRQADRQTDAQDHVLSQADALTKNWVEFCQKSICAIRLISLATLFNDVQEDIW